MIQRTLQPLVLRHILACAAVAGTALPLVAVSPAPAAEVAGQQESAASSEPCSPQLAQCVVTWSANSDYCKERKDKGADGKCTTLLQCQAETLPAAKAYCEHACGAGGGKGG